MTGRWISRRISRKLSSRGDALAVLILGLVMGCIFCLSGMDDLRMTDRAALTPVTAVLQEADGTYSRRHLQEIRLTMEAGNRYFIPSAIATEALLDALDGLSADTHCTLLTRGTDVLHLEAGGKTLLDFDKAAPMAARQGKGFVVMGAVFLLVSAWHGARLIWPRRRRR